MADFCRRDLRFVTNIIGLLLAIMLFGLLVGLAVSNKYYNEEFTSNICYASNLDYFDKYRYGLKKGVYVVVGELSYIENKIVYNYPAIFDEFDNENHAQKYITDNINNTVNCYTNGKRVKFGELNDHTEYIVFSVLFGIMIVLYMLIACAEYYKNRYTQSTYNKI